MNIFNRKSSNKTVDSKDDYALIVMSDTHINSTTAICPAFVNLDDGGTYRPSDVQVMLRKYFEEEFVPEALRLTEGYKRILLLNGDIGELDSKNRSNQVITRNRSTILRMMYQTLAPIIDPVDAIIVVRGTEAHTGKSAWAEEMFARDLSDFVIAQDSDKEIFSHWHAQMVFGGVRFDMAHHGRMGGMRHTQKNYANRLAQETMDHYRDREEEAPDVVIRSHNHRRASSGHNWPVFGLFTPSWQLKTAFVHRIGQENSNAEIGGDIFLCHPAKPCSDYNDGYYELHNKFVWHPITYQPELRPKAWEVVDI